MSSLQVGGGELASFIWFELKGIGVTAQKIMPTVIHNVGTAIQYPENIEKISKITFEAIRGLEGSGSSFGDSFVFTKFNDIFIMAIADITMFLKTNMPNLLETHSKFGLGFNGSSLLINTEST